MDESLFPTRTQEPYADLLKRDEWLIKKSRIIARDKSKCCECGKAGDEIPLEVHHKYYMQGLDPWEYPDDVLVTLCSDCHHKWHQNHPIQFAEKTGNTWYWTERRPCMRCDGVGYLHEYRYYKDGICFRCWGERFEKSGQRVELFTEQLGTTPQEYFDVFVPLTDEDLIRIFADRGHNVSFLVEAEITIEANHIFVELVANTGLIFDAFLDSSMIDTIDKSSSIIQHLNIKTLLYKECMNRNHQKYIVVKGDFIPYKEAQKKADEVRSAHNHNQAR